TDAISKNTRRARGRSVRAPLASAYRPNTIPRMARVVFSQPTLVRNVARYRIGTVVMSAAAVTVGVDTASRSYPRRYDTTDSATVRTRMMAESRIPPTMEMVTNLKNEIDRRLNASAESLASAAR